MLVSNTAPLGSISLVSRTNDAAAVNEILNHPSVFPFVTVPGVESIDVTDLLANPFNYALMADRGCILCCQLEPGIYEVHTNFIRLKHGERKEPEYVKRVCLSAYRWMFTHTDCMVLHTRMPEFNRVLRVFAPLVGWTVEFEREKAWPYKDDMVNVAFASIRYDDWFRRTDDLAEIGKAFHDRLEAEFVRHGAEHQKHADELCHDKAVGACAEMIFSGQPEKGVVLYNRWARFAGYLPIDFIRGNRPDLIMLDIGDAVLQILDHDFKVVLCR